MISAGNRNPCAGQASLFEEHEAARPSPARRQDVSWNLWHGCTKYSAGCANCYVFRGDSAWGINSEVVRKTGRFTLPVRRARNGSYTHPAGTRFSVCFTSDFLHPAADDWRPEAWAMMRERSDCAFFFLTKRIERFAGHAPPDWGSGEHYAHITIGATCESEETARRRLPVFLRLPIKRKVIALSPLLSAINLEPYLSGGIAEVVAGGESGPGARPCHYEWITALREQCVRAGVNFRFHQTGARFIKDGKRYHIPRRLQHSQARKAALDYHAPPLTGSAG